MNSYLIVANVYIAASWCAEDRDSKIWLVSTGMIFLVIGVLDMVTGISA